MKKPAFLWLSCVSALALSYLVAGFLSSPEARLGKEGESIEGHVDSPTRAVEVSNKRAEDFVTEALGSALSQPDSPPSSTAHHENSDSDVTEFSEEITIHLLSDFRLGDLSNIKADGPLRLGDETGFTPRGGPPDQRFGIYVAPEQESDEIFDQVIVDSEAEIPEGSELAFEFRTRLGDSQWSVWQRIAPNEMGRPVSIGASASAWQYRLTFHANDPSLSPEVSSVAFVTRPASGTSPNEAKSLINQRQQPDK